MKINTSRLILTASATVLCTFAVPVALDAQAPQYNITILTGLGGTNGSGAYGINASGQVAGYSTTAAGTQEAVVWNGSAPTVLTGLGGAGGSARGINASGQVDGFSYTAGGTQQVPVVWNGTTPTILTGLGGAVTLAVGINASGQVVGYSTTAAGTQNAVVWSGATPTVLTGLGGATNVAIGINASGQVVGVCSATDNLTFEAVVWNGTTPTILNKIGGNFTHSEAVSINDSGQIAGSSDFSSFMREAVVWNGTTPTILPGLGGGLSTAYGINAFGQVVGMSYTPGYASNDPFIYTGGVTYDLNDIIMSNPSVTGITIGNGDSNGNLINDNGEIAAYGMYNGEQVALRLTPAPEPASAALLLGGGALLALRRRRRAAGI